MDQPGLVGGFSLLPPDISSRIFRRATEGVTLNKTRRDLLNIERLRDAQTKPFSELQGNSGALRA